MRWKSVSLEYLLFDQSYTLLLDPPFNQFIENLSCTSADDYNIEGEMGVSNLI